MEYTLFEAKVMRIAGEAHYNKYDYLVRGVQNSFRERFLHTLNLGFKIPDALEHINKTKKLADHNYYQYINYLYDCVGN